jgi:hypothetical protein
LNIADPLARKIAREAGAIDKRPLDAFFVRLTGVSDFTVRHPKLVSCDINGRGMTIADEQGSHLVEMLLVAVMEPTTSPAKPLPEGSGPWPAGGGSASRLGLSLTSFYNPHKNRRLPPRRPPPDETTQEWVRL